LTVKSLLEVVQTGAKNIEISVMESYGVISVSFSFHRVYEDQADMQNLETTEIERIVKEIEGEKEAEAERKRQRVAATQAGQSTMAMGAAGGVSAFGAEGEGGAGTSAPGGDSGIQ
jgi:20S proteasome subunit alpha 4